MALVNIKPALYVADDSHVYQVGVDGNVLGQESETGISKLGGDSTPTIPAGTPALPSSVKPRRAYMKNPAGKGRYVICLTPDGALFTDPATTISLEDSNNAATTFTRVKTFGEDFGKVYANV